MPIYEYRCETCGEKFEKLVRSGDTIADLACPRCQSEKVDRAISLFGTIGSSPGSSPRSSGPT